MEKTFKVKIVKGHHLFHYSKDEIYTVKECEYSAYYKDIKNNSLYIFKEDVVPYRKEKIEKLISYLN